LAHRHDNPTLLLALNVFHLTNPALKKLNILEKCGPKVYTFDDYADKLVIEMEYINGTNIDSGDIEFLNNTYNVTDYAGGGELMF
jgi:hypothetical protein